MNRTIYDSSGQPLNISKLEQVILNKDLSCESIANLNEWLKTDEGGKKDLSEIREESKKIWQENIYKNDTTKEISLIVKKKK